MKKTLMIAAMLGVALTACSNDDVCFDTPENDYEVIKIYKAPSDTILECQQWINAYDKDVWDEKIEITIQVLEYCIKVPDLQGCKLTQYIPYLRNEPEDPYELMGMVDAFREYNSTVFMDTVEETEIFDVFLREVLNITWAQYELKYHQL